MRNFHCAISPEAIILRPDMCIRRRESHAVILFLIFFNTARQCPIPRNADGISEMDKERGGMNNACGGMDNTRGGMDDMRGGMCDLRL